MKGIGKFGTQLDLFKLKVSAKYHSGLAGYACFGGIAWSSDDKHITLCRTAYPDKSSSFWSGEENLGNSNLYTKTLARAYYT